MRDTRDKGIIPLGNNEFPGIRIGEPECVRPFFARKSTGIRGSQSYRMSVSHIYISQQVI